MGPNRIMRGGGARPGLWISILCAALALGLSACGGGGDGGGRTTTVTETTASSEVDQEADAGVLDEVLARQTGAVAAYERTLPSLRGERLAAARLFRAQEQEHIDGILELLRALGEPAESEPETIEVEGLKTEAEHVLFLYELERATIGHELAAIAKLTSPSARSTLVATVANQAQHLVLLRRFLGADLARSIPSPFENGTAAAPSGMIEE